MQEKISFIIRLIKSQSNDRNVLEIKKIKSYLIKKRKSSFVFFNLTITKFLFWLLRHFIQLYKNKIYDVFFSGCYCFLSLIVIIISHKHNESCLWLSINYWFGLSGSCYTISNKNMEIQKNVVSISNITLRCWVIYFQYPNNFIDVFDFLNFYHAF